MDSKGAFGMGASAADKLPRIGGRGRSREGRGWAAAEDVLWHRPNTEPAGREPWRRLESAKEALRNSHPSGDCGAGLGTDSNVADDLCSFSPGSGYWPAKESIGGSILGGDGGGAGLSADACIGAGGHAAGAFFTGASCSCPCACFGRSAAALDDCLSRSPRDSCGRECRGRAAASESAP